MIYIKIKKRFKTNKITNESPEEKYPQNQKSKTLAQHLWKANKNLEREIHKQALGLRNLWKILRLAFELNFVSLWIQSLEYLSKAIWLRRGIPGRIYETYIANCISYLFFYFKGWLSNTSKRSLWSARGKGGGGDSFVQGVFLEENQQICFFCNTLSKLAKVKMARVPKNTIPEEGLVWGLKKAADFYCLITQGVSSRWILKKGTIITSYSQYTPKHWLWQSTRDHDHKKYSILEVVYSIQRVKGIDQWEKRWVDSGIIR